MVDSELGITIVFNGCIYNYPELRTELEKLGYRFFSSGDTEVIAKAWHAWSATGNPTATIELERSVDFAGFAPGDATTVQIVLAAASARTLELVAELVL